MNRDFHFYGTYLAALAAGWEKSEAETIANAAAYIDHYTITAADTVTRKAKEMSLPCEPRFTFPADDANWFSSTWSGRQENSTWTIYHFLPGNKPTAADAPGYQQSLVEAWGPNDSGGKHAGEGLTRPLSGVSLTVLNELRNECRNNHHLLGIATHVFEDTWAHQNFSGRALLMNAKHDNNDVQVIDRATGKPHSLGLTLSPGLTQQAPYLGVGIPGHARFGMAPDLAFLKWSYWPFWSKSPVMRDNQEIFIQAWDHVVYFLTAVRGNTDLHALLRNPPAIDASFRSIVKRFVEKDMLKEWRNAKDFDEFKDQCMAFWREAGGKYLGDLKYTAKQDWVKHVEAAGTKEELLEADAYRFNEAAWIFWKTAWRTLQELGYGHTIDHFSSGANEVPYVVELKKQALSAAVPGKPDARPPVLEG